jgi:hypothetical protein
MFKRIITFIILSIYTSTCSSVCLNKKVNNGAVEITKIADGITDEIVIKGGKVNRDINDADVKDAADFAVSQLYSDKDYVLISAQSQVVAGTNFFLTVKFSDNEECQITVYDRFGDKSITSNTCGVVDLNGDKQNEVASDFFAALIPGYVIKSPYSY